MHRILLNIFSLRVEGVHASKGYLLVLLVYLVGSNRVNGLRAIALFFAEIKGLEKDIDSDVRIISTFVSAY